MNENFQNALLMGNVSKEDSFTTSNLISFPKRLVEYNPPTVSKVNYIEVRDSWVYIFNINYKLFLKKIRNICNSKNIQNLFDIKYNNFDFEMYKRGRISRDRIRIELIRFKEFFSIEVINLLQMIINTKRASFKNVYKIIITDLQGNAITPFCKSYHYLPEVSDKNTSVYKTLPQAEAAFWVNTGNTTLSTTARTKSPVSAISPSGLYDTRGHLIKEGSANFGGVELGHYVSVDGWDDYYYQNGEKVAPDKAFSVKMNSDGLFHYMVYSFKENGLTLKGAKSLLDRTEELPTSFYDIKHEGGIDGRWLVKVHFYNNWEQYTPGITTVSPQTYPDAEKYFLDGKYEDCFMALSKDTTINPIVSLLISCSSILDYSQKQRNE